MTPTNDAPVTVETAQIDLINAVIDMYHTTRMADCPPAVHILRQPIIQRRLAALASAPAGDGVALEAIEQAVALIQEAKGAEGPNGGFVTDHLDSAESWLDKATAALARPRAAVGEQQVLDELIRQFGRDGIPLTQEIYAPVSRAFLALQSPPAKVEG